MKVIVVNLLLLLPLLLCIFDASFVRAQYFRQQSSTRCLNPNQRPGTCVSIYDCQTLFSVLQRQQQLQPTDAAFLRASACNNAGGSGGWGPYVCCASDTGFTRQNDVEYDYFDSAEQQSNTFAFPSNDYQDNNFNNFNSRRERGSGNIPAKALTSLLPQLPLCGGVTIDNKIYSGSDTGLFEFPWMVLLEYRRRSGGIVAKCAGSLINQRYIVTAAHCVVGAIERRVGQLIAVRLGEYDTTKKIDCNQYSCAQESVRAGVEEIKPHELYKDTSVNQENDIALVRLDRNIRFSEAIKPICLPSALPKSDSPTAGTNLIVAGWGRTLKTATSPVKQKLTVPFVEQQQCRKKYSERKVPIVDSQICAGGKFGEDSCDGDSGGPLMRFRDGAWVLEGIVSFGFKCGLRDWPAVHTRVSSYTDWIQSNVRA